MSGCEYPFFPVFEHELYVLRCTDLIFAVRFLDLIKPFVPILPEVAAPERKTPFRQRLMWTGVSSFFLMLERHPLSKQRWRRRFCGIADECDARTVNSPHLLGHESNAVGCLDFT